MSRDTVSSSFGTVELTKRRRSDEEERPYSAAHLIPNQVLAHIAGFLPVGDAVNLVMSRAVMREMDKTYRCHKRVCIRRIQSNLVVGNYSHVTGVRSDDQLRDLPTRRRAAIRIVELAYDFGGPISLPALQELRIGDDFNGALPPLPPSLRVLVLGDKYNQPMDDVKLPDSLLELTFGRAFNQPVLQLPPHLTKLAFGHCFSHSIERLVLPSSLRDLWFNVHGCYRHDLNHLSTNTSLRSLRMRSRPAAAQILLPPLLETIELFVFACDIVVAPISWPATLRFLDLRAIFFTRDGAVCKLPDSLVHLCLPWEYAESVRFPSHLEVLSFDRHPFERSTETSLIRRLVLPASLQKITFGSEESSLSVHDPPFA